MKVDVEEKAVFVASVASSNNWNLRALAAELSCVVFAGPGAGGQCRTKSEIEFGS